MSVCLYVYMGKKRWMEVSEWVVVSRCRQRVGWSEEEDERDQKAEKKVRKGGNGGLFLSDFLFSFFESRGATMDVVE